MAVNIGPKIGIDGEKEYRDQLKNIIQQQKTLKAEMQETASGFDKNATAMQKAKAKAENLNKQIAIQKQRAEEARKMVEASTEKYGEADTRTQQWKEALANANTELNKLQNELKDTNPIKAFGEDLKAAADKLGEIGGKIESVGSSLTKNVTAPIMAAGGATIAAFNDVDKGMDIIVTKTGATGEALEGLQDTAKDLATTLPISFEDAGIAVGEINTRFDVTGDKLKDLSSEFLKFAEINHTDVTKSVDDVQSAMAAWDVDSKKTSAVLDTLTAVAQKTGASVDTLASGVGDNVTLFTEMGFSMSDAIEFLGQLDKNGVDASSTMAGLKKALANATKDGKSMSTALDELQASLISADNNADAYSAAMELFGNKAGPQLAAALKDGRLSIEALGTSLETNLGTVDTTFENTLDGPDKFKVALNNVKAVGADVGGTLLEMVVPVIEKLSDVVKKASKWWGGLDDQQKKTIITVAGVVAAVGPVVTIIGKVVSGVGGVISAVGTVTTVLGGLGLTLGPVIAIIAGVAAAIAGVILVIKNWDKITRWFSETWESVSTTVANVATTVTGWVSDKWETLKSRTAEAWSEIKSRVAENGGGIKGIISTAGQEFQTMWQNAFAAMDNITGGKLSEIVGKVGAKLTEIKDKFTNVFNSVRDFVQGAIEKIKSFFNFSWELPKIKLPHFSISGKFSLSPPSIPHINVDWYAKAYKNPVMFTQPTVLATNSGVKGFGDGNGGEIVVGQSMLYAMIRDAAAAGMKSENNTYGDININVFAQPDQDVEELAEIVSEKLNRQLRQREATWA